MPDNALMPVTDRGTHLGPAVIDWRSVLEHWLNDLRLMSRSDATLKSYRWAALQFGEWLDQSDIHLGMVNRQLILEYRSFCLKTRQWSHATIAQNLSALHSLFEWMYETLEIERRNPVSRMPKTVSAQAFKRNPLTDDDLSKIVGACNVRTKRGIRDRAILLLMAYTGVRSIEVRRALRCDLDMKGSCKILRVQGKGRVEKDEFVVIPDVAWKAMQAWLAVGHKYNDPSRPLFYSVGQSAGEPLSAGGFINIMRQCFKKAGVVERGKSAHSIRHTAITKADLGGAPAIQLQWMARHRSFDTTLRYIHQSMRLVDPAEMHISYEGLR